MSFLSEGFYERSFSRSFHNSSSATLSDSAPQHTSASSSILAPAPSPTPWTDLYSTFVFLCIGLKSAIPDANEEANHAFKHLLFKELGFSNVHLTPLGHGTTFTVSVFPHSEESSGLEKIVLKHTIPRSSNEASDGSDKLRRIRAAMLELRALTHEPLREHKNIVDILGVTWEIDPFDHERRWPVLILERAMQGTLLDFLAKDDEYPWKLKLSLAADTILGLEMLHATGIIHGDLKLENLLIFDNPEPNPERPFIVKLGDFGGIVFGVDHTAVLPTRTQPWNAPEWREDLSADALKRTDVYSLGFVLWRLFADGRHPFRGNEFGDGTTREWYIRAEEMKMDEKKLLGHLKETYQFREDVDLGIVMCVVEKTIRLDPLQRSLDTVRDTVTKQLSYGARLAHLSALALESSKRPSHQARELSLPFSFEGILRLDSTILSHIVTELDRTAKDITRPDDAAEARYGLAVLYLTDRVQDELEKARIEKGLEYLESAALAGHERAKAYFYRLSKAFGSDIPFDAMCNVLEWLLETATKGLFQSLEDINELGHFELSTAARQILCWRYSGVGSQTYDDDMYAQGFSKTDTGLAEKCKKNSMSYMDLKVDKGDNLLHLAARCGLRRTVSQLLANDSDHIDCENVLGETPLLLACRSGHYFVSLELLEAGADPGKSSKYGEMPLHWLISFHDRLEEICRRLAVNANAVTEGWNHIFCGENRYIRGTPLLRAISKNRLDVVQTLLQCGADATFGAGQTSPQGLAARLHYPDMLKLLFSTIAPGQRLIDPATKKSLLINVICGGSLFTSGSSFYRAIRHGGHWKSRARETLQVLLDEGGKAHLQSLPGTPGLTALVLAASYADADIVEWLLDHGGARDMDTPSPLPEAPDECGTPLTAAILAKNLSVLRILLERGAKPTTVPPGVEPGTTLLYTCAESGLDNEHFAQALIEAGVPVDGAPPGWETALACAVRGRSFRLAGCLLAHGADVNGEFSRGRFVQTDAPMTVLGHVLRESLPTAVACLDLLLDRRRAGSAAPRFIVSSAKGISALHLVASKPLRSQDDAIARLVLSRVLAFFKPDDMDMALQMELGGSAYSALHLAAYHGNIPVVRGLLDADADSSLLSRHGHTALEMAQYRSEVLREKGAAMSATDWATAKARADAVLEILADDASRRDSNE